MIGDVNGKVVLFFFIKGAISTVIDWTFKLVMIWSAFKLINELL